MKKIIFFALIAIAFSACEKEEGKGGTSTIRGTVTILEYNGDYTNKVGEYPGTEVDVYIIYGNKEVYGDRFRTDHNGVYEFKYLQEGTYTLYAMSKDTTSYTSEMFPVFQEVQITGKDQTVEVPEIVIVD